MSKELLPLIDIKERYYKEEDNFFSDEQILFIFLIYSYMGIMLCM